MDLSRYLRHRGPVMARTTVPTALFSLLFISIPLQTAGAQTAPPPGTKTAVRAARQETLRQITDRLTQTTGVRVLTDTALSRTTLSAPEDAVTRDTLDDYLTRLTRRLPAGTAALKVYLPSATENRRFSPDAVAQLARAQMELLGRPAPNTVQIQGKILSLAEAEPIIRALGLEPVYVLTSRQAPALPGGLGGNTSAMMDALTKQLGVANVADIPPGTYKVMVPGPDGTPQEATVEVENSDGKRRIMVRMGGSAER